MKPTPAFFHELQTSPSRYFKQRALLNKSKPSTADPFMTTRRKKLSLDLQSQVNLFFTDSPHVVRDTLPNLMKDALTPSPKQLAHFKIKHTLHKKSVSSAINTETYQILKELKGFDNDGFFDFNKMPNTAKKMEKTMISDELFIKRKEVFIKNLPARFGLKLPDSVDNCRKLISKKDFHIRDIQTPNGLVAPPNLSNILRSQLKKKTFQKKTLKMQRTIKMQEDSEYYVNEKKFQSDEVALNDSESNNKMLVLQKDELPYEKDDEIAIFTKSFGPANGYFNLNKLNKRKTQKDILQSVIQRKKTLFDGESPKLSPKKSMKNVKDEEEEYVSSSDEEGQKKKNDKKVLEEMKSKRFRNMTADNGRVKKSNKLLRNSLREALAYFASIKLDLAEVIFFIDLGEIFIL